MYVSNVSRQMGSSTAEKYSLKQGEKEVNEPKIFIQSDRLVALAKLTEQQPSYNVQDYIDQNQPCDCYGHGACENCGRVE